MIEVDNRSGVPSYSATGDGYRFTLDGEQLIPVGTYTPTDGACAGASGTVVRYVLRKEGRFARILRCGSGNALYWEVTDKGGITSTYGRDARNITSESDSARLISPATLDPPTCQHLPVPDKRVTRWCLTSVTDLDANRVSFEHATMD